MCPKESEIADNIVLERKKFGETSQPGSYQFCNFWHQSLRSLASFPAFGFHQIPLFLINFLFCLSQLEWGSVPCNQMISDSINWDRREHFPAGGLKLDRIVLC